MATYIIVIICVIALILFLYLVPIGIWFQALISGVHTSLLQLIFMRFVFLRIFDINQDSDISVEHIVVRLVFQL